MILYILKNNQGTHYFLKKRQAINYQHACPNPNDYTIKEEWLIGAELISKEELYKLSKIMPDEGEK